MIVQIVMFSVPEALAIAWLAYSLSGSDSNWKRLFICGLLTGVISVLIRPFILSYVVNVVLYVAILILFFTYFKIAPLWKSITAVSLAMPFYILFELISISVLIYLLKLEPALILGDLLTKLAFFTPQITMTILLAFLLRKYKTTLFFLDLEE